jgi:beta-aspartyl-peptidase (threonine type)
MWALALHGGATEIEPDEEEAYRAGCLRALEAGRAVLSGGGPALDAVVAAVCVLEDDPTFNAGNGSARNADGEVEMCSAIMDGLDLGLGAVTVIRGVRNPIAVARALMGETEAILAAEGALAFAREKGLASGHLPGSEAALDRVRPHRHDTVGCVALDAQGRLAAGTSTGGLDGVRAGRIGDSPLPGCGLYADNGMGAVVLSGDGEMIARAMTAARILHDLSAHPPGRATRRGLDKVSTLGGEAGAVLLLPDGRIAHDHASRDFCVASQREGEAEPTVTLRGPMER